MYVRFVVDEIDEFSGVERGIFQAMYRLWRAGHLARHEEEWWAEVRAWFNLELERPDRLARSRRPGANECAISWFRANATEHIARAREVVALLAQHDIASRMLITDRPGYIVYEDDFQVAAEPFRRELR
jgi:hypothetical protein